MVNPKEKVVVFLPAYRAEKTLLSVYNKIPRAYVDEIVLVDDASNDGIESVASGLDLRFFSNPKNLGYGGNLKACVQKALDLGGDILIELHPDDQYDPQSIPEAIQKMREGYGLVTGSRFMKFGLALKYGMPLWKYVINQLSRPLAWLVLGVDLSDYHCGFRVYHRRFLNAVNFTDNDNDYLFAFQILFQAVLAKVGVAEIPVTCRYYPNVTQASFKKCMIYGAGVLKAMGQFLLARFGWKTTRCLSLKKDLT